MIVHRLFSIILRWSQTLRIILNTIKFEQVQMFFCSPCFFFSLLAHSLSLHLTLFYLYASVSSVHIGTNVSHQPCWWSGMKGCGGREGVVFFCVLSGCPLGPPGSVFGKHSYLKLKASCAPMQTFENVNNK